MKGALTDADFKSKPANGGYSLFNSPKIFSKEGFALIFPTKKRLNFDENVPKSSRTLPQEQPSYLQASQQPNFDSDLFSRQKTSKYSHPNSSVNLVPHKNPSALQTQSNKENKVFADSGSAMFVGMLNKTIIQEQHQQSDTCRSTSVSIPNFSPLNAKFANNVDLSQRSTAGSQPSTGKSSRKSSQVSSTSTPTEFLIQKSISPLFVNKGYEISTSKEKLAEQNKVNKLKKEVIMSPRGKRQWEEIEKKLKATSTTAKVEDLIISYTRRLSEIPNRYWWKVFFDLAEVLKKECYYHEAKQYYKAGLYLQPYVQEIWLEYAKMEEDYGYINNAKEILKAGLRYNPGNENLIIKFLRLDEKIGRISDSRRILATLQDYPLEKTWKLYLEGALLEAKAGQPKSAKRVFKILIQNVENQGSIFYEYARFEESLGNITRAVKICFEGICKTYRYSNLWSYFLRLCEKASENIGCIISDKFMKMALNSLPKDMMWKIYLELAGICERKDKTSEAKGYVSKAILSCPENVKWKCYILGSRIEMRAQNSSSALKVLKYLFNTNNDKQKSYIALEASKVYEYQGLLDHSYKLMYGIKDVMKTEWKLYLDFIHMLIRNRNIEEALRVTEESLQIHNLAGRLWASLIQLYHIKDQDRGINAYKTFLLAIQEVPKSGEVWCEGARVCLNPANLMFSIEKAQVFLDYALHFTPQYGDTFIELLRLYFLQSNYAEIKKLKKKLVNSQPNYGNVWQMLKMHPAEGVTLTWKTAKKTLKEDIVALAPAYHRRIQGIHHDLCQNDRVLLGIEEYNAFLLGSKNLDLPARWKLIFHTDQSLFQ